MSPYRLYFIDTFFSFLINEVDTLKKRQIHIIYIQIPKVDKGLIYLMAITYKRVHLYVPNLHMHFLQLCLQSQSFYMQSKYANIHSFKRSSLCVVQKYWSSFNTYFFDCDSPTSKLQTLIQYLTTKSPERNIPLLMQY